MSRSAIALALILTGAGAALAEARPTISCAAARARVERNGAAVVHTSPNVYDRYVLDRRFCAPTQGLKRAFAATTDTPACPLYFTCVEPGGLFVPY